MDNKLSLSEKQKEFLQCAEQLSALSHSHEPFSPSLAIYFGELERIRRLQHVVEPTDSDPPDDLEDLCWGKRNGREG